MDWRSILLLSLPGGLIGALGLFNLYGVPVEATLWTVLLVAWVVALVKLRVEKPFVSGLLVGVFAGIWTAVVQGSFASVYNASRPGVEPAGAVFLAVGALVAGTVWGLLCGGATWALVKRAQKRAAPDAASA